MQVCDIYCRAATQEQGTPTAMQAQERACREYCAEHGLTIGLVLHEVANGYTFQWRPAFDLIRARYRNKVISGVVVMRPDRITRNYERLGEFYKEIERCQTTLYCAIEVDDPIIRFIRTSMKG